MTSALMSQLGSLAPLASLAGSGLNIKNPNDMYVALLKSRSVQDAMVRRFDLQKLYKARRPSDARKELDENCTIQAGTKDGLIRITVEDKDPSRAAEMANAYVDEYKKLSANLAIGEAAQRRLFFEQQLVKAKDDLANAEEELKRTQQSTGLIQPESQARALVETVATLRGKIAITQVQIQSMSAFATETNPELEQLKQQLAALRSQLKKLGGTESLDGDLILPKGKVPESALQYLRKLRDVKYHETVFELLAKQFEIAKLDEAKQGSMVQVVDPAVIPDKRSSPQRTLIVLGALILGLIGASIWVWVRDGIASASKTADQALQLEMLREAWSKR